MARSRNHIAKDFHVSVHMPGHLPSILNSIIVDGLQIAIVHIASIVIAGKAKRAIAVDKVGSRITAGVGRPQCYHACNLTPIVGTVEHSDRIVRSQRHW